MTGAGPGTGDERVALRVKFEGAPPPQSQLYFRGPVLSQFDGRNWTANASGRTGFPIRPRQL